MKKKNTRSTSNRDYNILVVAIIVVALGASMLYKQPVQAASERGKTAAAVIGGGGLGALILGTAASGKWAPLGFGAGAVGALLIKRAIRKSRERRAAMENGQSYHRSRYSKRHDSRKKYGNHEQVYNR